MPISPMPEGPPSECWADVVAWLAEDPDKIHRLLAAHKDTGCGTCHTCSAWCQDPVPWPCMLRRQASDARALYLTDRAMGEP